MNLKQALKKKNKLVQEMSEQLSRAQIYNSYLEGQSPTYSGKTAFNEYIKINDELIELKTKIHLAKDYKIYLVAPMYSKIFRLSELKSRIDNIRRIRTNDGEQSQVVGDKIIKTPYINEVSMLDRDNIIKTYENEIELIQDELDEFNVKTIIN